MAHFSAFPVAPASTAPHRELLEQLGNKLLRLLCLGQGRNSGLHQDLVLAHVRGRRAVIGRRDVVFSRKRIGRLRIHHVLNRSQGVDVGSDCSPICSDRRDRSIDGRQRALGTR